MKKCFLFIYHPSILHGALVGAGSFFANLKNGEMI
jgi:hypothetical protein